MEASERKNTTTGKSFDSLGYAKSMESVGFTRQQAEMMAQKQAELIDERLATKTDIELVRADLEQLRLATKADIELIRADLATGLAKTKAEIVVWVGGLLFAQTGLVLGLIKFHG
jgi:hypothetical protein